ncbi:MAG: DUF302 domain-containing protein [Anaerolineae bacterium]
MAVDYGLRVAMNLPYQEAIERATAALKEEGFGILTQIDVNATLTQKLDADFRKYIILGACNPPLAHRALQADLEVGLLLPCNVIVYEADNDHTVVSIVDPLSMLGVTDSESLAAVADDAFARLNRVAQKLAG